MTDNPFETAAWTGFETRVKKELVPKVRASVMSMVLNPGEDPDVKVAVELGMSILLDKPLIVVAQPDQYISPALERAAEVVVRMEIGAPGTSEALAAEVNRIVKERGL